MAEIRKGKRMSHNQHNLPCWTCGGNSSVSYYLEPEPHLYCFKCEGTTYEEQDIELTLDKGSNVSHMNTKFKDNVTATTSSETPFPVEGIYIPMVERGISKGVAQKFGVQAFLKSGKLHGYMFPSTSSSGDLIAQKYKSLDKRVHKWIGAPSEGVLFGQHLFPTGGKFLTITEGEEDAMAVYQMAKTVYTTREVPVISIRNGASSAEKECKKNWEYINSFNLL
jgi:twinkle protein